MNLRFARLAPLLVATLLALPAAHAASVKDVLDREVPALKDGAHLPLSDVQAAILAACERRDFQATVVSPGLITARWVHGSHSFDVSIPFSDSAYSIRYKDSQRMDYDAAKQRIDGAYNDFVSALSEHIDADLERALKRFKQARKRAAG